MTILETRIKENLQKPGQLEQLYQDDKKGFEKAFLNIYPEIAEMEMSGFWKARLEATKQEGFKIKINKSDIIFLLITCLIAGFLIKIPHLFTISISEEIFYAKNAGLIVLLGLSIFAFLTKKERNLKHLIISGSVFIISAVYINLLPAGSESHSIILACIHLPLLLWSLYGLIYIDFDFKDKIRRIDYIRYNGDLAILAALIMISGGILAGVTFGLFSAIELNIQELYINYVVIIGLVSLPVVATYIVRSFPSVTHKIAPLIAAIFSPLVLITLVVYLLSIVLTGKDPYNDRDFLIVFNLMLLGVMAIIVFSVSETSDNKKQRFSVWTLFALTIISLLVDLIALSAILYRVGEFGFTPNRTAVLGSNLLIFGNLVWIMTDLYKVVFNDRAIKSVELTIARYLPVYAVWTVFMVFIMPFIFGLK